IAWCWRWRAESRSRKIPTSVSPTFQMARSISGPRPGIPRVTHSSTNGRSTIPAFEPARYRLDCRRGWRYAVPLETSHFGFGLGAPELIECACRLLGSAELSAQIAANLRHAEDGFGRD